MLEFSCSTKSHNKDRAGHQWPRTEIRATIGSLSPSALVMEVLMQKNVKHILYWSPRVLCILFAIFMSLFAFDVFEEGIGFWEGVLGFLIHLTPVYVLIVTLLFAWRWEWIGTVVFFGLAMMYVFQAWDTQALSAIVLISGPLTVIGMLFLLNWIYKADIRK